MMDTSPLWLPLTLTAAVSFTVGAAVASLWWRNRCARLAAGEVQRRRDRAERIERVTAAVEPGGGKSRPPTPRLRPNPRLSNLIYEGGRPAGWAQAMIDAQERPPVDAGGRPPPSGDWYLTKELPQEGRR